MAKKTFKPAAEENQHKPKSHHQEQGPDTPERSQRRHNKKKWELKKG